MPWQMLLPYVAVVDGKPQRQMFSPLLHQGGRCYCHSLVMWQEDMFETGESMSFNLKICCVLEKILN